MINFRTLIINGTLYKYQQHFIKEDELWECAYVDESGNMAEVNTGYIASYDESLGQAKKELEALIKDNDLQFGTNNVVIIWKHLDAETQRKIMVRGRKFKEYLMGEWDNDDNRFVKWREFMHNYCGIWFPRSDFDYL